MMFKYIFNEFKAGFSDGTKLFWSPFVGKFFKTLKERLERFRKK